MSRARELSRRALLRGAGTAVALPFLEAMLPWTRRAARAGKPPPRRLLIWFVPNGIYMEKWTPAGVGAAFELTPLLEPLARHRGELLVLSGLGNPAAIVPGAAGGDHARGTASFITATPIRETKGEGLHNGVSLDQVAAAALGGATRFPSLELGVPADPSDVCDVGHSCAYTYNISWSAPTTPAPKETSPRALFDRVFGAGDDVEDRRAAERRRRYGLSVLDHVREDAIDLAARLGRDDRRKLEEYLAGVRALERRLAEPAVRCAGARRPPAAQDWNLLVRDMSDLAALAFQCDLTRVITFMTGNGSTNRAHGHLDIPGEHHVLSHHHGDPAALSALERIGRWEVAEFAHLLDRLRAIEEPDATGAPATALDHAAVLFSSEIADGDRHAHTDLPVLLAGRAAGALAPGRHLRYDARPIADLFLSLLRAVGVPAETFGQDGRRVLPDLAG